MSNNNLAKEKFDDGLFLNRVHSTRFFYAI